MNWNVSKMVDHGPRTRCLSVLTDAGLVGRLVMDKQGSWPTSDPEPLDYKIAENIWWLSSIAEANGIDLETALNNFLKSREQHLN